MSGRLVLVLGGARSGKSDYAQKCAEDRGGATTFIATAQALDTEMHSRIEKHKASRPSWWHTVEEPLAPGAALRRIHPDTRTVILDCITLLVANLMGHCSGDHDFSQTFPEDRIQQAADRAVGEILDAHRDGSADLVIISNEVGLGLVPPNPAGRVYRDVIGRVNCTLAQAADHVIFLFSGIPVDIKAFPAPRLFPD
jgi:adenosylcobinamide kinase / adenosylcobinamide-phosphate guanylyltransferase